MDNRSARINLTQPYEVTHWCRRFGCTREQLRQAVERVVACGLEPMTHYVAAELRQIQTPFPPEAA